MTRPRYWIVWGIESNAREYLAETAHELADEYLKGEARKTYPVNTLGV